MKQIQIIIPDRALKDIDGILRDAHVGGMSHYRIQGRGATKAEEVAAGRGTMRFTPDYIPRTKVEAVVKDEQVDIILDRIRESLGVGDISGKIFVIDVPAALDVKTGRKGESAI